MSPCLRHICLPNPTQKQRPENSRRQAPSPPAHAAAVAPTFLLFARETGEAYRRARLQRAEAPASPVLQRSGVNKNTRERVHGLAITP